jgi:biotin operon repressor
MSRTARLFLLMDALRAKRQPVTAAALGGEMNVSERTMYRDIATLVELGAPIDGEAGIGYVLRTGFFMPPLMFGADEIEALGLGARWVRRQGDESLLVAEQLGIALDLVEVNLMEPADRRRLEQVNPNSKLPVLVDGDFILWESCAIMQYLCDITPGQTLCPRDARQRADVNRWLFWTSQHFAPAVRVLVWENVFKGMSGKGGPDPVALARGTVDIAALAQVLDRHLAGRIW